MSITFPAIAPAELRRLKAENAALNRKERHEGAEICRSKPLNMWVESSSRCNFRCKHCANRGYSPEAGDDFPEALIERIVPELFPTLEVVQLQGDGEPLLSRTIDQLLDAARLYDVEIYMVTNGSLLNERNVQKLLQQRGSIWISLDGFSKESFEYVRLLADYHQVLNGIERLVQGRAAAGKEEQVKLGVIWCAMEANVRELPAFIRQCAAWGLDNLTVNDFSLAGIPARLHHQQLGRSNPELANRLFAECRQLAAETGLDLILPPDYGGPSPERSPEPFPPGSKYPQKCYSPWDSIQLYVDGSVCPCCSYYDHLGNLWQQSFEEIWNGEHARRVRRTVNSEHPPYYCKNCHNWWGINGGSPGNTRSSETAYDKGLYYLQKYWPNERKIRKTLKRLSWQVTKPKFPPTVEPGD